MALGVMAVLGDRRPLEVPAGFISQQQIRVGDKVQAILP